MSVTNAAERHGAHAARFTDVVLATTDWSAPTPVPVWTARDVVGHLVEWFPAFLAGGGIQLPAGPDVGTDPVAAWRHQCEVVQDLLEQRAAEPFTHPRAGTHRLADAVDRFYTADVFMHTWDLARATGQDDSLDPDFAAELLAGLEPLDQVLRDSGQYGPRVAVAADASVQDRLVAFIGRDPGWHPRR